MVLLDQTITLKSLKLQWGENQESLSTLKHYLPLLKLQIKLNIKDESPPKLSNFFPNSVFKKRASLSKIAISWWFASNFSKLCSKTSISLVLGLIALPYLISFHD